MNVSLGHIQLPWRHIHRAREAGAGRRYINFVGEGGRDGLEFGVGLDRGVAALAAGALLVVAAEFGVWL
jgi:hypothetical protein